MPPSAVRGWTEIRGSPTREEFFAADCHHGQDRLGVTLQIVCQLEVLPDFGGTVELVLNNVDRSLPQMTYPSHDPEMMVPSGAVCKAQTLCS